jgi:tungstate transport system substrate-binding protein
MGFRRLSKSIVLASTTSQQNSGLFGHIDVKVAALGTGQALDAGRCGDADVVFVPAPKISRPPA